MVTGLCQGQIIIKIEPKTWIHEFTQSASTSPSYQLPISKSRYNDSLIMTHSDDSDDMNCILIEEILYMRIFLFKHK